MITLTSTESASATDVWRSVLPGPKEIQRGLRRLHMKAGAIMTVVIVSYWLLVIPEFPVAVRAVAALTLVGGLVAVGTGIMHDANHGSFSKHRWINQFVSYTSDALGASSALWRVQHNSLHHGNPNVSGYDGDIDQQPFARLAPTQPWKPWHRAQHIYMWPLYGFMAMKNLLISDLVSVLTGKIGSRKLPERTTNKLAGRITAGKLFHIGWAIVVPLMFNPWWGVLIFYAVCSWLVGFLLAITFQLAHCVDSADFLTEDDAARRGDDFVTHQMRTTVDVDCRIPVVGHLFRWLVGGLDHQIEHHLAPKLPHTVYPALARRFRLECRKHGIDYRVHRTLGSALRSHARWLHAMGCRPAAVTG